MQENFYYYRRTAEDTRKAIGYYEEAIRLDPRYALAYAKLVPAAVNLATSLGGVATKEQQEMIAKARASAKSALAVDPNLAFTFRPLAEELDASLAQERMVAWLSGFFGLLALLLA